jgi:hypothetical protein
MLDKIPPEMYERLTILMVVVFGAIVHATTQLQTSRANKLPFTISDFLILFIIACFAGMIFGILAMIAWPDKMLVIIFFTAIGAFLGMVGLNKIASLALDILTYRLKANSYDKKD